MALLLCGSAAAFAPALRPAPALGARAASSSWPAAPAAAPLRPQRHERRTAVAPLMGLFGLGWAEIGIIGVVALLFFGPEKLAPLAKDIGKSASGIKEVTDSFAEGLKEGTVNADELSSADAGPEVKAEVADVEKEEA